MTDQQESTMEEATENEVIEQSFDVSFGTVSLFA